MPDDEAYMQLVLCNTQSELHALEEGKHAAESGLDLKAYAEKAGKNGRTLHDKVKAWRVLANVHVHIESARDAWRNLAEIHAAPEWLWPALVAQMIEGEWTGSPARAWAQVFRHINSHVGIWEASNNSLSEQLLSKTRNLGEIHKAAQDCWFIITTMMLVHPRARGRVGFVRVTESTNGFLKNRFLSPI